MVRVDDVEMTEGVASSTPHTSHVPTLGQPCLWSSHRRRRRVLHVGKSQDARQGPPHKLRVAERWRQLGSYSAILR